MVSLIKLLVKFLIGDPLDKGREGRVGLHLFLIAISCLCTSHDLAEEIPKLIMH